MRIGHMNIMIQPFGSERQQIAAMTEVASVFKGAA